MLDDRSVTYSSSIERVILHSGKIHYDLLKERASRGLDDANKISLVRIEELSPFPSSELLEVLQGYTIAKEIYWLQEEPRNQGAWTYVNPRITNVLEKLNRTGLTQVRYIGREEDSVPAVGVGITYKRQQNNVISAAFEGLT